MRTQTHAAVMTQTESTSPDLFIYGPAQLANVSCSALILLRRFKLKGMQHRNIYILEKPQKTEHMQSFW